MHIRDELLHEINQIIREAPIHKIVRGKQYLYFSIQPTQEQLVMQEIHRDNNITCYAIRNFRENIVGYCVDYNGTPKIAPEELGIGIFYTEKVKYRGLTKLFSDQKFRLFGFDDGDYFASVKWRSNVKPEAL